MRPTNYIFSAVKIGRVVHANIESDIADAPYWPLGGLLTVPYTHDARLSKWLLDRHQ